MKKEIQPERVLISRTDNIGDVVLTLPLAGMLKEKYPNVYITFIGKKYTVPIISLSRYIDDIIDIDQWGDLDDNEIIRKYQLDHYDTIIHVFPSQRIARIAKKSGIEKRIGTSHRWFHWLTCNFRIDLNRKDSDLHESQLNTILLKPFGIRVPDMKSLINYIGVSYPLKPVINIDFDSQKKKVILHPKSKGSAREWGLDNFRELAERLTKEGYQVIITGSQAEGEQIFRVLDESQVTNTCGKLTLEELINLIGQVDCLVAASTGVLHIAAVMGVNVIGLFVPKRPIHPGRWKPLGRNVEVIVREEPCKRCPVPTQCECMKSILVDQVFSEIVKK